MQTTFGAYLIVTIKIQKAAYAIEFSLFICLVSNYASTIFRLYIVLLNCILQCTHCCNTPYNSFVLVLLAYIQIIISFGLKAFASLKSVIASLPGALRNSKRERKTVVLSNSRKHREKSR
ncbi:hypothetical protein BDF20DRAFT_606722 [Mycotypha africana]|uniref:uncharacterized protein n=1 Tax=Mycotypha africana TaxID=64632 RepID=UPI002300F9ED|nr:uncharacterized protein BDF20DRAFT_606722 [Mycotypha africana]KAI8975430.1 hypothetical protein BDF20DRAFT_606722 [Mycotypha africana]